MKNCAQLVLNWKLKDEQNIICSRNIDTVDNNTLDYFELQTDF